MKSFLKVLSLAMVFALTAALAIFCASADEGTEPELPVIYISSSGADSNDGKTEATAVHSLEAATAKVGKNGGEIIVLDDMELDVSKTPAEKSAHRIYLSASNSTIYINGRKKADNSYPSLTFYASDNLAPSIELGGPLAVNDLNIKVRSDSNFWISVNGHTFTSGENVKFEMAGADKAVKLCGGRQDATASGAMAQGAGPTINIFGGNYGDIWGGSFSKTAEVSGTTTINMIGGSADNIYGIRSGAKQSGNISINYYGGTVNKTIQCFALLDDAVCSLNIYNYSLDKNGSNIGSYFKEDSGKNIQELMGTAPEYAELSAVTEENAEPGSDDHTETSAAPSDTAKETKPAESNPSATTKAPDYVGGSDSVSSADSSSDSGDKGCKSSAGTGVIAVLAIAGAGTAVIRRKKAEK